MLDGIQKRLGVGVKVVSAEGCHISEPDTAPNLNSMSIYKAPKPETDEKLLSEAVQVAQSADVIGLAIGGNEVVSRESIGYGMIGDSDSLDLPGRQMDLVREIVKLGKPTVADGAERYAGTLHDVWRCPSGSTRYRSDPGNG